MSLTCGPRVAVRGKEGEGTDARARLVSEGGERGSGARDWAVGPKQAGPQGEKGARGKRGRKLGRGLWPGRARVTLFFLCFFSILKPFQNSLKSV